MDELTIDVKKRHIRNDMVQQLAELQPSDIERKSRKICEDLIAYLESMEERATLLLAYSSMRYEVQTEMVLNWAQNHQIDLGLPRISPNKRCMTFHQIEPGDMDARLETHRLGFKQPTEQLPVIDHEIIQTKKTVVIVPGVAFSPSGKRLGHGGGFYDRFLASVRDFVFPLGVCFREQVLESLPTTRHDQSVSRLFTD